MMATAVATAAVQEKQTTEPTPLAKFECFGKRATIVGTPGPDVIVGTPGPDVIVALGGNDRVHGRSGNDLICGGPGKDVLFGDAGSDWLAGGRGSDRLFGGSGIDRCETAGAQPPQCENPGALTATAVRVSTDESGTAAIDVVAAAANPDGRHLVVTALQAQTTRGAVSVEPDGKTVRFDTSGAFTALAGSESATTRFGYTLSDLRGHNSSAVATVVVHGIDNPPTAVADSARTTEGQSRRIDPLANDTDPDGGERRVISVTQPVHGAVTVLEAGRQLEYEPDPGYCNDGQRADRFSYSLNGGSSAVVSVAVTCLTRLAISAGLYPEFEPDVSDYVVHCDGSPVEVSGRISAGESVSVDGGPERTGILSPVSVPLEQGQEFEFTISGEARRDYHVRCLPPDFPTWEYQQFLPPRHAFYVVAPTLALDSTVVVPHYAVIFDDNGVPVWWYSEPSPPVGASVLANGEVAWWRGAEGGLPAAFEIRQLDGSLVETVVPASGGETDVHEFQTLRNGNHLIITSHRREHVDLSEYGGGADETVMENDIEELKPGGELVWEWSTEGHIEPEETDRWWVGIKSGAERTGEWDEFHMNAIEPEYDEQGDLRALLVSLRHTDAVYRIDRSSGEITWKLGGTTTPESLTVLNDPEGAYPFGGQHDVRLQADGTVTVHDNNTALGDPLRAVRYEIDEAARSARMVEAITDPEAPTSMCCGSARRSADGSWLMSWGANSLVTEFDAAKQRTFQLGFGGDAFSYRAEPAPDGVLSLAGLRAGMDAMNPRR